MPANPTPHPAPPGSYVAFIISPSGAIAGGQTAKNNLGPIVDAATGKVATNFAGYVIAQSEFQYCHGVANVSASGLSNTYLGLILDKARNFTGTVSGGGGISSGSITLPTPANYRVPGHRRFADELETNK